MGKIEAVIFDWAGTTVDYGVLCAGTGIYRSIQDMGINDTGRSKGTMGMTEVGIDITYVVA